MNRSTQARLALSSHVNTPRRAREIAGVDWVTANSERPAVANMSLGVLGNETSLNYAVKDSIASGVTYVVSAGNKSMDACNVSPALVPEVITVGNVNPLNDMRAFDSNYGNCLDLFAPGEYILSAWNTDDNAEHHDSGTTRFGGNVGAGLLYEATPHFGLQGSYNFHMVNTPGTSLRYSTLQGGVRFRF